MSHEIIPLSQKRKFKKFVESIGASERVVLFHDWDADGITAAVVLDHCLRRAQVCKEGRIELLIPDRERNAWTPSNHQRLKDALPDHLFVLDLGVKSTPVLKGTPTCYIDHHRPEGIPSGATVITAYTRANKPIPNTSLMAWELCGEIASHDDLDWVAAIGLLSDLGDRAPFELLRQVRSRFTLKDLREVTSLVNAIRRASRPDPTAATRALSRYPSPRDLLRADADPDVARMREARAEVAAAMLEAKKAAPIFSGKVALIQVHSPCQIHPLIAQIWRSRLPKFYVIAANTGYLKGRVNFSMRSVAKADGSDKNAPSALDFLKSFSISGTGGEFGHGHDHATGGSLPFERWEMLLEKMGFKPASKKKSAA